MLEIQTSEVNDPGFTSCTMFHPKAAFLPDSRLLMTVQEIHGSDSYGPVLESISADAGRSWSPPEPVPQLGYRSVGEGVVEGVCDVVPDFDPASGCTAALGHNVYYREGRFYDTLGSWDRSKSNPALRRRSVYCVRNPDGVWGERCVFDPPGLEDCISCCCGCGQKVVLGNGEWFFAFYYMRSIEEHTCRVRVFHAKFDGNEFLLLESGNELEHLHGRGLLEPSLIRFNGRFHLTLRAEDGAGWHCDSEDGLHYTPIRPWRWENGTLLETSTTQQHWLILNDKLFLCYTRNAGYNAGVFRFRAPLFIAQVDPDRGCLLRATEQVVFSGGGDWNAPETVLLSGNFMPLSLNPAEALILDGECRPQRHYSGSTMIARIREAL